MGTPLLESSHLRIWRANDVKPHHIETFKLSNDPRFEERFWDVIGLYRHGTVTLFAVLNYLDGKLISRVEERHAHVE